MIGTVRTVRKGPPAETPILAIFGALRRLIFVKSGPPSQPILFDLGAPKRSILVILSAPSQRILVHFGAPSRPLLGRQDTLGGLHCTSRSLALDVWPGGFAECYAYVMQRSVTHARTTSEAHGAKVWSCCVKEADLGYFAPWIPVQYTTPFGVHHAPCTV